MSKPDPFVEALAAPPSVDAADLRSALFRAQKDLARAKRKGDELARVTVDACRDAVLAHYEPTTIPKVKADRRPGRGEHALLHATDWQGAKKTVSYNSQVMRDRVLRFATKVERLTADARKAHPVRSATLMLGGDMIEGLFNFPTQPFEIDATLFEQFVRVSTLLQDLVERLLATFETINVVGEWGNHGRLGSKRSAVPRADNADRMTYELARQLILSRHGKRVTWEDCPEDVQRVEIGNYRAILLHGDEIGRNGFASPSTIVSHIARWQSGSFGWDFRDAYIGHYHTHNEWALPNGHGSVYQTGSTESDNRYAGVMLASSATPSQRLHFVDPDKGRITSSHKVWLDVD